MSELPSGTVTFLLTDVEGSTALWEAAPEAMREALTRHDALFEAIVRRHGGAHIRPRGEGDSRFAVYAAATDGVAAALALQRSLADERWPTPRPIRVRVGIHTGEAQVRDDDYYGAAVNRCARIRALGHGGQTLLSEATAALVRDDLPAGAALFDLGAHRLKDLTRPERVYQLAAQDLPSEFPPLDSIDARPNNLPVQTTSLIGREREVSSVRDLLLRHDVRLLTLTGPGGAGKTRLALQVAANLIDQFADGVFFVDLAPVSEASMVVSTIATVLGATGNGERPLDDLQRFLQSRSLLLVLDNFEQIVEAGPVVTDLLAASAGLKVLVTSRAVLQVRGELELEVPPLDGPPPERAASPNALLQYPAVALFVERTQAIRPEFALTPENALDVATICARLDGLPLALELAAARSRVLAPAAMVRRLEQRLPLLSGGPRDLPTRQQALRDTIAWSYDLLDPADQQAFRGLAVFVGGFTLDAAEAVVGDDGRSVGMFEAVERLVAQSLIRADREDGPEPRFRMLETIREFGLERLDASDEAARVRQRHLAWCLDLLERAGPHLSGMSSAEWLDRIEAEHDNIRAALYWSLRPSIDAEIGFQLAGRALSTFWSVRAHLQEGRSWLARLLARSSARTSGRARALGAAGYLALRQNDHAQAASLLEEAATIGREVGDAHETILILRHLGILAHELREYDRARTHLEESLALAREHSNPHAVNVALRHLADLAFERGEHVQAAAIYQECLILSSERGAVHEIGYARRGLGNIARARGEYPRSRELLRESLRLFASLRDRRCTPICLEGLACTEVEANWAERAVRMMAAAQALQATTGALASPSEMADQRRTEADARTKLGEERFAAVWAAGAAMSLDEAVAYALTDEDRSEIAEVSSSLPAAVPLSVREREVVALIARGFSNREIADELVLSVRTVERHIENVYNRLGISGRAGRAIVTAFALRHGLTEPA